LDGLKFTSGLDLAALELDAKVATTLFQKKGCKKGSSSSYLIYVINVIGNTRARRIAIPFAAVR
jgi:hypothetical protein